MPAPTGARARVQARLRISAFREGAKCATRSGALLPRAAACCLPISGEARRKRPNQCRRSIHLAAPPIPSAGSRSAPPSRARRTPGADADRIREADRRPWRVAQTASAIRGSRTADGLSTTLSEQRTAGESLARHSHAGSQQRRRSLARAKHWRPSGGKLTRHGREFPGRARGAGRAVCRPRRARVGSGRAEGAVGGAQRACERRRRAGTVGRSSRPTAGCSSRPAG